MISAKKATKRRPSRASKAFKKACAAKTVARRSVSGRIIRSAPKSGKVALSAIAEAVKSVSSGRCGS